MKITFFVLIFLSVIFISPAFASNTPDWVKNTAGWWATDMISETEFVNAIEFLVNEKIIEVNSNPISERSQNVPEWVKNTAGWWATDMISETEFVNAIEFLIELGIISISNDCESDLKEFPHVSDVGRMILCENIDLTFLDEMIYSEKTESSISLNQYGFRGPEFSAQKSDNTYRIFVVGSSVAYGQHVLEKDTISTHLQNLFDEYDSELKIEVINAGFGNAWSKTEVKWIKENLSEFEPDLVIVLDGWTDVTRELVKNEDWDEDANIEKWTTRWNDLCEFGTEKGFDTIVTIQPILGSSNKIFTNQESMEFRHHLFQNSHVELLQEYANNLYKLEPSCTKTANLTNVFDGYFFPIYMDLGHMNSLGGKVISDEFFKLSVPIIFDDELIQDELLKNIDQAKYQYVSDIELEKNFSGMVFEGEQFDSINNHRFWMTEFWNVDFSNTKLFNNDFRITSLYNTDFRDSTLKNVQIIRGLVENNDFSNASLTNVKFSTSNIVKSNFNNSILDNIENYGANYLGNDFTKSIIKNTLYKRAMMIDNNFSETKFENVTMESVILADSNFSGVDFSSVNFKGGVDFAAKMQLLGQESVSRGAILHNTDFRNSNVENVIFSLIEVDDNISEKVFRELMMYRENIAVDLSHANFSNLDLSGMNLIAVNLKFVDLSNTDLSNTDFRYAELGSANLEGANLEGANLEGANLEGANLDCINNVICE
jgi:uncharacterized protein YjbI with pentapeptide repeats